MNTNNKKIYQYMMYIMVIIFTMGIYSCSNEQTENMQIKVWIPGDEQEYGFYFNMFEEYKSVLESQGKTFDYEIEQQPWGDYWTKLPLEINNGRGPDLFLAHVAYADVIIPIARELSLSKETLDLFKVSNLYLGENGKPLFIPTVFVSKIMYADSGIVGELQTYPNTWDELISMSTTYSNSDKGIIGFDFPFHILWDFAYQNGLKLTNNQGAVFTDVGLNKVLEWTKLGAVDYLKFGNGSPENSLNEGTAAFIYGEPWMEFWASDEVKSRIRAFPVPGGKTHNSAELSFGISKNASEKKYEMLNDFIKFMLTDTKTITSIVKGNSGVPNNKKISVSYKPFTAGDAVLKTFEQNSSFLSVPPRGLETIYAKMLESVVSGKLPAQAIKEAEIEAADIDVSRLYMMESEF